MNKAKFVLSKKKVLEQYNKIEKLCDMVSYSFKTNNEVGKILEDKTGCVFNVAFKNSVDEIKDKKRIWFLVQGWNEKELKELIDKNITSFIIDNENDLRILEDFLRENNTKVNILLRLRLKEHTIFTEKYFVYGFYSDAINKNILRIIEDKKIYEKIDNLGIHFHRKTQNIGEWSLKFELENLIKEEVFKKIDIVSIGGGLPSYYRNSSVFDIEKIFEKIKETRNFLDKYNIKLIIEPGRFIAAPSIKLITYVRNVYENTIIINASVYNTNLDTILLPLKLLVENELDVHGNKGESYLIKGYTPCSLDIFRYSVRLKNKPKIGDKIVFINAGAYNYRTDFCDLNKLNTEIVEGF
ncbi:decarboxylase [Candidatus Woesearchaeota archaeon]|nr:decarboxylase [Candidatus Woesearchaeota archaeon]